MFLDSSGSRCKFYNKIDFDIENENMIFNYDFAGSPFSIGDRRRANQSCLVETYVLHITVNYLQTARRFFNTFPQFTKKIDHCFVLDV